MAWDLLRVDYTDAVWNGLKKYVQVNNDDNTVSFQDVTIYSNRENSFFGAIDANRMNEALNTIMSMLENGTDLYGAFQNYFADQKTLFESKENAEFADFVAYIDSLKQQGDNVLDTIKIDYRAEIDAYEAQQELVFNTWFNVIRGQLSTDAAGNLQNQIDDNTETDFNRYYGMVNKVTNINKSSSGVTTSIVEVGDGVTATTTFETLSNGKKIVTIVNDSNSIYKYTKEVLIETVDTGRRITESYSKEVK